MTYTQPNSAKTAMADAANKVLRLVRAIVCQRPMKRFYARLGLGARSFRSRRESAPGNAAANFFGGKVPLVLLPSA